MDGLKKLAPCYKQCLFQKQGVSFFLIFSGFPQNCLSLITVICLTKTILRKSHFLAQEFTISKTLKDEY